MAINPNFSALEAVITAKVEAVATNIDNKDLLIQMKALEAAVANLSLTRVIAEGTYQSGQLAAIVASAQSTVNGVVASATTTLNGIVTTGSATLSAAATSALSTFNTSTTATIAQINTLQSQLGNVNANQIAAQITAGLASIQTALTAANTSITTTKNSALALVSTAGSSAVGDVVTARGGALDDISSANTSALSGINTAKNNAIAAVGATSDVASQLRLVRDDRWLGLDIYSPTVYPV